MRRYVAEHPDLEIAAIALAAASGMEVRQDIQKSRTIIRFWILGLRASDLKTRVQPFKG